MPNLKRIILMMVVALTVWSSYGEDEVAVMENVLLTGQIDERNIEFSLKFEVEVKEKYARIPIICGDVVLKELPPLPKKGEIIYDAPTKTYYLKLKYRETYNFEFKFGARPEMLKDGWQATSFTVPASRVRTLEISSKRKDLEVQFPGALRVKRETTGDDLKVSALLGADKPFAVMWKPRVEEMKAELVYSSAANMLLTTGPGALRMDTVYHFAVSQGKLSELRLNVPEGLNIIQVKGPFIRDWKLNKQDKTSELHVILNRELETNYKLQVISETLLGRFPLEKTVPVITPTGVIRSDGIVLLGSNSAIKMKVLESGGLSRIDAEAFALQQMDDGKPRIIPRNRFFHYMFATSPFNLKLHLADIYPSYDIKQQLVMSIKEEDLLINAKLELDIRDSGVRSLKVTYDSDLQVSHVGHSLLDDYYTEDPQTASETKTLVINFKKPIIGTSLLELRLGLGKSPLKSPLKLLPITVQGARKERGYMAIAADTGIKLKADASDNLRKVHVASIPMRVANANLAYRFRESAWTLELKAYKEKATIIAESFHLVSLGEGIAYGNIVMNYIISGAPVDELYFRIPDTLRNVEFVGRDVRRWEKKGDEWTVKLQQRVSGEYNIGISFNQPCGSGSNLLLGGVECRQVENHRGYIVMAGSTNFKLAEPTEEDRNVLAIDVDEIPSGYRLMVNAPILKSYKFIDTPHSLKHAIGSYPGKSTLPLLVEVSSLTTDININDDGSTQTVTKARYKVKNLKGQFLTLSIPKRSSYLKCRKVINTNGTEKVVDLKARLNREKGTLMIPIDRHHNPNDPLTVELEFGQPLKKLSWKDTLELEGPQNYATSTFVNWTVNVFGKRCIFPLVDGTEMRTANRLGSERGITLLSRRLSGLWERAFDRWLKQLGPVLMIALASLVSAIAVIFKQRKVVPHILVVAVVMSLTWIGGIAGTLSQSSSLQPDLSGLKTLSFTKAANLSGETLQVAVKVLPDWCCFIQFPAAPIVAGLALIALVGSFFLSSRLKLPCWLVTIAGSFWVAAQFPHAEVPLLHILTWGIPAAVLLFIAVRLGRTYAVRFSKHAAATALILFMINQPVEASKRVPKPEPVQGPILTNVEYKLIAEKDSMQVEMTFALKTEDDDIELPLLSSDAIFLSKTVTKGDPDELEMTRKNKRHVLLIKDDDEYAMTLKFLAPMTSSDATFSGRFMTLMPFALTNKVSLTIPQTGLKISAPAAITLDTAETKTSSSATATFVPGGQLNFSWAPRVRQLKKEKAVFFVEGNHLYRFMTGTTRGYHMFNLQIAQGELSEVHLRIPDNMTVTSILSGHIGAWRFDPDKHSLEVKFSSPRSGEYKLALKSQLTSTRPPFKLKVSIPEVLKAENQRATLGLAADRTVVLQETGDLQELNPEDFSDAPTSILMKSKALGELKKLFRITNIKTTAEVTVMAVIPELRTTEQSVFTVGDERLVFNTTLSLNITKAGLFNVELLLPKGYDIDALTSPQISHWDDTDTPEGRTLMVHFKNKFIGTTQINLSYSRPIETLPQEIVVPNPVVKGALRHSGMLELSSDRAIRLIPNKPASSGVSDITGAVFNTQVPKGTLTFKLLRNKWTLALTTELVTPRINVDYLHHAKVNDATVRHSCVMRFNVHNAGSKVFRIKVPSDAIGLQINGPNIARKFRVKDQPGVWQIELDHKYLERPYPMTLSFETRVDRKTGNLNIETVKALDCDLQRGYVAIGSESRVELDVVERSDSLQQTDPRQVPATFGKSDIADAVFCFRDLAGTFKLVINSHRHESANQLDAEVKSTQLATVVTMNGGSVNHLQMRLMVNGRRYLRTTLPPRAEIWSLAVNKTAVPITTSEDNAQTILIPLQFGASTSTEMVDIELTYVIKAVKGWQEKQQGYTGPAFDLPLKEVAWDLYMPEQFKYSSFAGNMTPDRRNELPQTFDYNMNSYQQQVEKEHGTSLKQAEEFQRRGAELAKSGNQVEARQALRNAYSYSQNDINFNEDARVQLNSLIRKQAIVGLVDRRDNLNWEFKQKGQAKKQSKVLNISDDEVERIQNSLNKRDSENLEMITDKIISSQEAARGNDGQLLVSLPICGKQLRFNRALQVKPNTPMVVEFVAKQQKSNTHKVEIIFCLIIAAVVVGTIALVNRLVPEKK